MAELDYAYLADYAQIDGGKISSLGGSYTHAIVPDLPTLWMTSVVGRIRVSEDEVPPVVRIEISPPDDTYRMRFESEIPRSPEIRPYRGRVGILFTVTTQLSVGAAGLFTFDIFINDVHARTLAFEVELVQET